VIRSKIHGAVVALEQEENAAIVGNLAVGGLASVVGALTAATLNGQTLSGGTLNSGAVHWIEVGGVVHAFGAVDPSSGGGVALAVGSVYYQTSSGRQWTKTGAGAGAWTLESVASDAAGGDCTGTLANLVVATVGGQLAAAIASGAVAGTAAKAVTDAATSANVAGALVARGGSGEISVGAIHASLSTFANNAAALIGGLVAGDVYQTAAGVVLVVV
jgi:hypothetical protein